ncbi:unnamed protein product [Rhizophagus irregularis]|nr:unnamed protein product [Rhizophagus irregularis]
MMIILASIRFSASGIWSLLGFGFQYLVFVRFYFPILGLLDKFMDLDGSQVSDYRLWGEYWYQFMGSNRYQLRFLGFDRFRLRFQLPIVLGYREVNFPKYTNALLPIIGGFFSLLGCDNSTAQFFRHLDVWVYGGKFLFYTITKNFLTFKTAVCYVG